MSKGVIVQINYDTAYILKNDGSFVTCKRHVSWNIGDVVSLPIMYMAKKLKVILASAAALFFIVASAGFGAYHTPVSYIEISVNPSVMLTVNIFNRVILAEGLTEDGKALINGYSLKNLSLYEAYSRLFNRMENQGFLKDAFVQLVVSNNSQRVIDKIENTVREATEKYNAQNDMTITLKRYTKNEYLSLEHPLPVLSIPQPANGDNYIIKPDSYQENTETNNPAIGDEQEIPEEYFPSEKDEQETETESNQTTETETNVSNTHMQMRCTSHHSHHGEWRDGWWDWDCER